jgi:hypothetical protein
VLAPPLSQQGRLAESGRRLDEDDRLVESLVVGLKASPGHVMPRYARRRDLEHEVVGGAEAVE